MLVFSCSHSNSAVKYPDMVADVDPFSIGSISASFDRNFSSQVRVETVEVIFYPRENEVALEFRLNMGQYRQLWKKEGRRLFIEAINRYKEDFENQRLTNKFSRTKRVYGRFKNRFQWKPLPVSATYRSSPVIELGYRFRDNSPYFTVYQNSAREESGNNRDIKESPDFPVYFTRAQAEELARLFDEAFLLSSVSGKGSSPAIDTDRDEYFQF